VVSVAASGNGRRAVSTSKNGPLKVWDVETGRYLRTINEETDSVVVSFDGRRVVSAWIHVSFLGRFGFGLRVRSLKTGRKLRTIAGHSRPIEAVALSRDERQAISASKDRTLKVWDLKKGGELRTLIGHAHPVASVAMSGDGRRAVSASYDGNLKAWDLDSDRVWDLEAGKEGSPPPLKDYETGDVYDSWKENCVVSLTGDGAAGSDSFTAAP
jgi:WD40 repeat protein